MLSGCDFLSNFFADGKTESAEKKDDSVKITGLRFASTSMTVKVGEMAYLDYIVSPSGTVIEPEVSYDEAFIKCEKQNSGVIVTGVQEGQTPLTVSYNNRSATCIITVSGYSETYVSTIDPYIYSTYTVLQLKPGDSEKLGVSLYNGSVSDIEKYKWTIDNSAIADISSNGQYCIVTAKDEGYAKITVTNSSAAYPYYIGIYVFKDWSNAAYITTKENIVTIRKSEGEKTLSFDVINPVKDNYKTGFNYQIIKNTVEKAAEQFEEELSEEEAAEKNEIELDVEDDKNDNETDCISIVSGNGSCIITPLKEGVCTLRVTNTDAGALYPLDVVIRVIEIIDNVYIEPSVSNVHISGNKDYSLSAKLRGIDVYDSSDFSWEIEDEEILSGYSWENNLVLQGLKNGVTSVYISHPLSKTSRQVMVFVEGLAENVQYVDSSCYLTTNQNYIKTRVGSDDVVLSVSLKGGSDEDSSGYNWSVTQNPYDGTSDVIKLETAFGTTESSLPSRAAAPTVNMASAVIHPNSAGSAIINVSNTKSYYSLDILVKVLGEDEEDDELLCYLTTSSNVIILKSLGETKTVNVSAIGLSGNKAENITWACENENVCSVIGSGKSAVVTAINGGETCIKVNHPDCENELCIYVRVGSEFIPDNETYSGDSPYACYITTTQNYINTKIGAEETLLSVAVKNAGLGAEKLFIWKVEQNPDDGKSEVISLLSPTGTVLTGTEEELVENDEEDSKTASLQNYGNISYGKGIIMPKAEGTAVITVSHPEAEYDVQILVKVFGSNTEPEKPLYLTGKSIISFVNDSTAHYSVKLGGLNVEMGDENSITWQCDNSNILVNASGTDAVISSKASGNTFSHLTVSHPKAEYDKVVLIITADTLQSLENSHAFYTEKTAYNINVGKTVIIQAEGFGYDGVDFSKVAAKCVWESSNPSLAVVERSEDNPLAGIVKGIRAGNAKITFTYLSSTVTASVYVYPKEADISSFSDAVEDKKDDEIQETVFDGNGINNIKLSSTDVVVTAVHTDDAITFTAEEGCDSYSWIVDGMTDNNHSNIYRFETARYMPGEYEISLLCLRNGTLYSILIQFTI